MTDPGARTYRVVVASRATTDEAEEAILRNMLDHLSPRVAPNGLGSSITITTRAASQATAENYALLTVGRALNEAVRVIMTVAL